MPNDKLLSAWAYAWGQFIDHDIDLTTGVSPSQPFNIAVPTGDPYFDPASTGTQVIPLNRSEYVGGTGLSSPRQQINSITAFLDASMVYGSDEARATALRTLSGGRMKTSAGDLLPYNTMGLSNDTPGGPAGSFFVAGDIRANENIELLSVQTLFIREHNRLADQISASNPTWSDERIYQRARKLVGAMVQAITFNEYLPALLGDNAISFYGGYRSRVNPGIANEFSTAAFRLGHSMLADDVEFMDNNGEDTHEEVALAGAFFNPALFVETGPDPMLKYLASSNAEEVDNIVVDGVRNFLFGPPGAGGLDLASLNIQRGRDHGLMDYNTARQRMGLPRVNSFNQITSDPAKRATLQSLYGSVNNLDLWVGGLAEDHAGQSSLGPLFTRIVADQFTRLRDGDRYWYQRDLGWSDRRFVESSTLSELIQRNTGIFNLQDNVFVFNTRVSGTVFNDRNGNGRQDRSEFALSGRTVNLLDDTGAVVESTTTDFGGRYSFSGVQIGHFEVAANLPTGWVTTTADRTFQVTRGQTFSGLNIGQKFSPSSSAQQPAVADTRDSSDGITDALEELVV